MDLVADQASHSSSLVVVVIAMVVHQTTTTKATTATAYRTFPFDYIRVVVVRVALDCCHQSPFVVATVVSTSLAIVAWVVVADRTYPSAVPSCSYQAAIAFPFPLQATVKSWRTGFAPSFTLAAMPSS